MKEPFTKAIFFGVSHNQMKLKKIIEIASEYFEKQEPLLLKVPHEKGKEYVDHLLWSFPKESFLPHAVTDSSSKELIVITLSNENVNQAKAVFNLSSKPIENKEPPFHIIYTLDDLSSSEKNKMAQSHYKAYKERGYKIISL